MSSYFFDKTKMQILIGSDHAGFGYKQFIADSLKAELPQIEDKGTKNNDRCDYPDYAKSVASEVSQHPHTKLGILICGSANGVAITANKYKHVRAALCWNEEITALARKHNDANIICLPARFITKDGALFLVRLFFSTSFEGGRHQQRVLKIDI